MSPQKYRKRPVVIEAMQCKEPNTPDEVAYWCGGKVVGDSITFNNYWIDITTLEGVMRAEHGDFIIRGVQGEFYPVKPDIFAVTYEAVTGDEPSAPVEINTPAVREAISAVLSDEMEEEAPGLAPLVAGRVFVILDRASAGMPFDAAAVTE